MIFTAGVTQWTTMMEVQFWTVRCAQNWKTRSGHRKELVVVPLGYDLRYGAPGD